MTVVISYADPNKKADRREVKGFVCPNTGLVVILNNREELKLGFNGYDYSQIILDECKKMETDAVMRGYLKGNGVDPTRDYMVRPRSYGKIYSFGKIANELNKEKENKEMVEDSKFTNNGFANVTFTYVPNSFKAANPKEDKIIPVKQFYNLEKRTYTVLWSDGTETTSHAGRDTQFDQETGFMACATKKFIGDRSEYMKYVESGKQTFSKKTKYSKDIDGLSMYELAKLLMGFVD
jgi:hypothetical protein